MNLRVLSLIVAALFATGCGYKGPLFMPKPKAEGKPPGVIVTPEPAPERPVPAEAAPASK